MALTLHSGKTLRFGTIVALGDNASTKAISSAREIVERRASTVVVPERSGVLTGMNLAVCDNTAPC